MIVNHELKIAYVDIPKVASTAIRGAVRGIRAEACYFTFAFIRHPWDRLVSALYSVLRSSTPLDERIQQYMEAPQLDSHIRPQSLFLQRRVDFIGRYERLGRDWALLQQQFDLPALTHENKGPHRPADWRAAPIDWDRWRPYFAADFELWNGLQ